MRIAFFLMLWQEKLSFFAGEYKNAIEYYMLAYELIENTGVSINQRLLIKNSIEKSLELVDEDIDREIIMKKMDNGKLIS